MVEEKKSGTVFPKVKGLVKKRTKFGHRWILSERDSTGKIQNITVKISDNDPVDVFYEKIAAARKALQRRKREKSISDYIKDFISERGYTTSTIRGVISSLSGFSLDDAKNRAAMTRVLTADTKRSTTMLKVQYIRSFYAWLSARVPGIENPADNVRIKSHYTPRQRIATDEEIKTLIECARKSEDQEMLLFVLLIIHTGARVSSIFMLTGKSLDSKCYLHLYNQKTKKPYSYPIPIRSKEIIFLYRSISKRDGRLWHQSTRNLHSRLVRMMNRLFEKDINGETLTPHSLRHTFATRLLQSGVPAEIVSKLLDHSNVSITLNVYAKFSQEQIDDAIDHIALDV